MSLGRCTPGPGTAGRAPDALAPSQAPGPCTPCAAGASGPSTDSCSYHSARTALSLVPVAGSMACLIVTWAPMPSRVGTDV